MKGKGSMPSEITQDEIYRYSRHLMIPEVGLEGQRKLKAASVLIVGSGGLGSPVALYLAAAGVGHIGLVDDDVVDVSNLQRQILHDSLHLNQLKVDSGRERLLALNPTIEVEAICSTFNEKTAREIASGYDILVDGTDNFTAKYLINDLCVLTQRPEVYGAVYRFEGQASVFDARRGPCYRCIFPEPPQQEDAPGCSTAGVFGVLPGVIGTIMAAEVIKLVLNIGSPLIGQLLVYDALEETFQKVKLHKQENCWVCGSDPQITTLQESVNFCADEEMIALPAEERITPAELADRLKRNEPVQLIDVREPVEQQVSAIDGAVLIPLEQLAVALEKLDRQREIVVFCRTGKRSLRAVQFLKKKGFADVRNLTGGINAWVRDVQPELFQY
jgi:adenylyltransferase/sulfurtransferase